MRRLILAAAAALALGSPAAPPAGAQEAADAIRSVISDQIDALLADDFATAFDYASPGIRRMFGTPETFGRMVRDGYPMVWRPADVRFADLVDRDGRTVQSVVVTDRAGVMHVLEYEMVAGRDGWRINGVRIRPASGAGA